MLAYVFWHWRRPGVAREAYESLQGDFQRALQAAPPPGFLDSRTFGISGAPWAAGGGEAYEDWYGIADSAALDPLNEVAVTASRKPAHDRVAAAAAGGTAGLYRLQAGEPFPPVRNAAWFGKPAGMTYAALLEALAPLAAGGRGVLWMRNMVLGPTPEFCLQTEKPAMLPPPIPALALELRTVVGPARARSASPSDP